jgi:hypothetical protein
LTPTESQLQLTQKPAYTVNLTPSGTAMAGAGVPMRTLQEWMGHRDIETTQRYVDYSPSAHEAAFVEAAFGPGDVTRPIAGRAA